MNVRAGTLELANCEMVRDMNVVFLSQLRLIPMSDPVVERIECLRRNSSSCIRCGMTKEFAGGSTGEGSAE